MSLCYGWGNCDCWRCDSKFDSPLARARIPLAVGEFYGMQVQPGVKPFRVLLISLPEIDERNERRAEVVVMEDNSFVKSRARCRPFAPMLVELP
jgi:hypothetical protein